MTHHLFVLQTRIQTYVADKVIYADGRTETSVSTKLEISVVHVTTWLQLYSCYLPRQKVCVVPLMFASQVKPVMCIFNNKYSNNTVTILL